MAMMANSEPRRSAVDVLLALLKVLVALLGVAAAALAAWPHLFPPESDHYTTSAKSFGCTGRAVALQAVFGGFVVAEGGGGNGVNANRSVPGPWETFTVLDFGQFEVALKTANGNFLSAEDGGGALRADAPQPAPATRFRVERNDSVVSLRSLSSNFYLVAEDGGGREVNANRESAGPWERFSVICR